MFTIGREPLILTVLVIRTHGTASGVVVNFGFISRKGNDTATYINTCLRKKL